VSKTPAAILYDSEVLYEVVNGKRVELPPMGARECHLAAYLVGFLWPFVRAQHLGRVESELLFLLNAELDMQRRPDVAFVSYKRWPHERLVPATAAWQVVPNLAVEVVSPTNTAYEVLDKVSEYFQTGVQRVWVVYPNVEQVYVYSSPTSIRVLDRSAELDGEEVLPGFRLPLSELFEREQVEEQQPR
jgi:Uma2 family endonuclease